MSDIDVIREIERELNIKLKKADKIERYSRAYVLDKEMQITGLGLHHCEVKESKRVISLLKKLKNLTEFYFISNKISDISFLKKSQAVKIALFNF